MTLSLKLCSHADKQLDVHLTIESCIHRHPLTRASAGLKLHVRGSTLASHQETFRVISEIKWYHGFLWGVRPWGPVAGMIARLCHVTQWFSTFWSSQSCSAADMRGVCLDHAMAKPYACPFFEASCLAGPIIQEAKHICIAKARHVAGLQQYEGI